MLKADSWSHLRCLVLVSLDEKMSPHARPGFSMKEEVVVGTVAEYSTSVDSSIEDSINSSGSTSTSLDSMEDDVSSPSGPLYDLSELISQLPLKKGLSKFYDGKSQSYTSLASVKSLEDLAKKGSCLDKSKMKSCKSYAGLNTHKMFGPKATISKKTTKAPLTCSGRRGGSFVGTVGLCTK